MLGSVEDAEKYSVNFRLRQTAYTAYICMPQNSLCMPKTLLAYTAVYAFKVIRFCSKIII